MNWPSPLLLPLLGLWSCSEKGITVYNTTPEVRFEAPEEASTFLEGESVDFLATVEDRESRPEQLVLEWISDLDGLLEEDAVPSTDGDATFSTTHLDEGLHTITLKATDPAGGTGLDFMTIHIETDCLPATECDFDEDGYTELQGDCDDDDDERSPAIDEIFNGVDDDCDGLVDEGTDGYDDDGDGFRELDGDCDDDDDTVWPGADEIEDGVDNDCDGDIDEGTGAFDDDGDGFTEYEGDCDDTNMLIHPGAEDVPNGVDDDCDGDIDEETDLFDDDGDGYSEDGGDCDDDDPEVHPEAIEVCDEVDNNCDGTVDEDGAVGEVVYYFDGDLDGYGAASVVECTAPEGTITTSGDCDDTDPTISPDAIEACDGIDNDCDGDIDEPGSDGCDPYYFDEDGDGFGHETDFMCLCAPGDVEGYETVSNDDCCDIDEDSYPDPTTSSIPFGVDPNLCGSHDTNCDGTETQRWDSTGQCGVRSTGECYRIRQGWESEIALCGDGGQFLETCTNEDDGCATTYAWSAQQCR